MNWSVLSDMESFLARRRRESVKGRSREPACRRGLPARRVGQLWLAGEFLFDTRPAVDVTILRDRKG